MSKVIETFLICDGNCGYNFGVDFRSLHAYQHRGRAKKEGWLVNKKGKDYCPDCRKKLKP